MLGDGIKNMLPHYQCMPGQARVFAVTVNWKRCEDTLECIASILKGGVDDVEVVAVENGSGDGSAEKIRRSFPQVHLIESKDNLGYAKGANLGVRLAMEKGATHILLLNNDAIGHPGFLAQMMSGFAAHPQAGVLGCKIFYFGKPVIWYAGGYYNRWLGFTRHVGMDALDDGSATDARTGYVTGCAMLCRREVFEKVSLFDEDMGMYAEDLDFCLRAEEGGAGGFECWYLPKAVVEHKVSMSGEKGGTNDMTPFRSYLYGRNMLIAVAKNQTGLKLLTNVYGQIFILIPYYFLLASMQKSPCSSRRFVAGFLSGMRYLAGRR